MQTISDNSQIVYPIFNQMKQNLKTNDTHLIEFRKNQLKKLIQGYQSLKDQFNQAMNKDLGLNPFMCNLLAHSGTLSQIKDHEMMLQTWAKNKKVSTPMTVGIGNSWIQYQPLGIVLVISAWNYPINTSLPVVAAAISAGNSVILKPSQFAPHVSHVLSKLFRQYLDQRYYRCIQGKVQVAKTLSQQKFDMIAFTGSTNTGKSIAIQAAKNLVPTLLQLGGKCPAIIDEKVNIDSAVLRVLFGKLTNAGQTCVGIDHVYLHKNVQKQFKRKLLKRIKQAYNTQDIKNSGNYSKIITQNHIDRLLSYINQNHNGNILLHPQVDRSARFMSPCVIQNPSKSSKLMNQQIFGPILPIITYDNLDNVIYQINQRQKPLSVYVFSQQNAHIQKIRKQTSSGSFVLNDSIVQLINHNLPFGGVGHSGHGRYHGISGFKQMSNYKSVLQTKTLNMFPMSARFPPYTNFNKKVMNFILKVGQTKINPKFKTALFLIAGFGVFYANQRFVPKL